jgi:hypothetical protein
MDEIFKWIGGFVLGGGMFAVTLWMAKSWYKTAVEDTVKAARKSSGDALKASELAKEAALRVSIETKDVLVNLTRLNQQLQTDVSKQVAGMNHLFQEAVKTSMQALMKAHDVEKDLKSFQIKSEELDKKIVGATVKMGKSIELMKIEVIQKAAEGTSKKKD